MQLWKRWKPERGHVSTGASPSRLITLSSFHQPTGLEQLKETSFYEAVKNMP